MTEMATTSGPEVDESRETSSLTSTPTSTETQTLITEQQVLLSTAAVALPAKTRRWSHVVDAISGALHAVFASAEKPPARRHYPNRHAWLENALMAREMDRL